MKPTDLVQVIKEFIDRNGNRYPARKEPYLYGEIPQYVRDNKNFVIPLIEVTVTSETIPFDKETKVLSTPFDSKRIEHEYIVTVINEKPDEEVVVNETEETEPELGKVEEIIEHVVQEELPVVKSRKSKKVQ
jgi:hypothetical protein